MLLKAVRNDSRKGGKLETCWTGPYVISSRLPKALYKLEKDGKMLKKSYNGARLKNYAKPKPTKECGYSRTKASTIKNTWLPKLGLIVQDRDTIKNNLMLDDKVINAAQEVLKRQFPAISGWQDTVIGQVAFESLPVDSVQIHHEPRRRHWVCSSSMNESVQVFDSMFDTLSSSMQVQLSQCYRFAINVDVIDVQLPSVQRQTGGVDCGLFAIAFAYELASGNEHGIKNKIFNQQLMRDHLITCLENEHFNPFPSERTKKRQREDAKTFEIELFCTCLMPEVMDMIQCDLCQARI